ncbi:MAG: hypothetical protein ACYCSO_02295 [Cuniculiplasma sp.]
MANIIVEHRWKNHANEEVKKTIAGIIQMANDGKLPEGFQLKSINVLDSELKAICNWEAPSINSMKEFLEKLNPPTKHEIMEAQKAY